MGTRSIVIILFLLLVLVVPIVFGQGENSYVFNSTPGSDSSGTAAACTALTAANVSALKADNGAEYTLAKGTRMCMGNWSLSNSPSSLFNTSGGWRINKMVLLVNYNTTSDWVVSKPEVIAGGSLVATGCDDGAGFCYNLTAHAAVLTLNQTRVNNTGIDQLVTGSVNDANFYGGHNDSASFATRFNAAVANWSLFVSIRNAGSGGGTKTGT